MAETFFIKKDGVIVNPSGVMKHFDKLEDGRYKLLTPKSTQRSLQQNAWFHAILPDIMKGLQDVGYYMITDTDKAKAFVKELFFKVPLSNGVETVMVIQDTHETSKEDFAIRAEKIIIWAQEYLGLSIAPPGKQTELYE